MATSIYSPINLAAYPLTSQIGTLTVSTSDSKVDISLIAKDPDGDAIIFSTSLYPYDGCVKIHDLASLIESDMRARGLSVGEYELKVGTAESKKILTIYSDYLAQTIDLSERFLTTMHTQRVYKDSWFVLTAMPNDDDLSVLCLCRKEDGTVDSITLKDYKPDLKEGRISGSFADIASALRAETADVAELLGATLSMGKRSKTYYIVSGDPDVRFSFRNCFNALEYIELKGIINEKTDVAREIAVCDGRASQYDRKINQTFEFRSEPLIDQEAQSIAQLVASYEVYIVNPDGSLARILITDHTCEIDNDDTSLSTVKLTWRYVDSRPHFSAGQIADLLRDGRIFTNEFSGQFR